MMNKKRNGLLVMADYWMIVDAKIKSFIQRVFSSSRLRVL